MPEVKKPSFKPTSRPEQQRDFLDLHTDAQPTKSKNELDAIRHKDLLSLKKQVIEEIKSEFELAGNGKRQFPGISRPGYVDPFSRLEQKQNNAEGDKIQLKGT